VEPLKRARELFESFEERLRAELPEGDRFDAHVHLGNDIDGTVGRYEELEAILDRYEFSRCFMFCLDEPDRHPGFRAGNDRTLAFAERSQGRMIPFVRLALDEEPIADHLRRLVDAYPDAQLIIAHAGIADLSGLAGCFAGRAGVFFDTSVWSAIDLLGFFHLVPPEQILYASDYPYGSQPNSLLISLRTARAAGLTEAQVTEMLAGNASRIADGDPPLAPSRPQGSDVFEQPMAFARIHQYLSMALPLIFIRQQDSFGALGLALNATHEPNGHAEGQLEQIRDLLVAARELWRTLPEAEDEPEARLVARTTQRLIHLADILAVAPHA